MSTEERVMPSSIHPSTLSGGSGSGVDAHLEDPRSRYQIELESIDARIVNLEERDRKYGHLRVTLVLVAIVLWVASIDISGAGWLGTLAFAAFFIVAILNEPLRDKIQELRRNRSVVERLIARIERDWERLATKRVMKQLDAVSLPPHRADTASDLDILGRASLFQLVSMAATMPGVRTLCEWLTGPAVANDALARSAAVAVLAPLREQRIRFYTLARQIDESTGDPDQFVEWATGEPWLTGHPILLRWPKISATISMVCFAMAFIGFVGIAPIFLAKIGLVFLAMILVINIAITTLMLGQAHQVFSIAMSSRRAVDDYLEIFSAGETLREVAGEKGQDATLLNRLYQTLCGNEHSAVTGMKELATVARAGGLRQSAGTFLIYLPLQAFTLWDVLVLDRLEAWQAKHADHVRQWFEALGELESLMSIAALRDDYPTWTDPTWLPVDADSELRTETLGHPLICDADRVTNDVTITRPGTILLVTGSNMSGKSTMLRSVGLNVALAGAGAVVCAKHFELPAMELATSIRISDDVSQGVSFYMAELNRLKNVVDHAREMSVQSDRLCLFLLDEILQGTNSRERQIAVVKVLDHLVSSGAIGAITTHDLELADEEELLSIAKTVHFRETIRPDADGNEKMTFDYKMREGVSPTTNALRLLEMVGLGESLGQP